MDEIDYFSPGQLRTPEPPLAAYRPAPLAGALGAYLEAYTKPGDLVLDLFCQNPTFILESVQAGRRALGANVNPALLLAASLGLSPVEEQAVLTAVTRLAETRKGAETLQAHIEGLYQTRCSVCGASTIAQALIWEREGDAPVMKRFRCPQCGDADELRQAPTDEADRDLAARFGRQGLSYWLLLNRAAPRNAVHRERVAALLALYTPRNLAAVSDLLLKYEAVELTAPVRRVLDGLLLDTFDRATSLRPPDGSVPRPRSLQRPSWYIEENVWSLLERALEKWLATKPASLSRASDLRTLLRSDGVQADRGTFSSPASFFLAPFSAGQVRRELPQGSAALILADPPRPDAVLWHLSALWSFWLWGSRAGQPLIPFLARRRVDKDWYWRGLRSALEAVGPLLAPEGRLVCLFSDDDPTLLEAVALAAAGARYELAGWGGNPGGEARLVLRPTGGDVRDRAREEDIDQAVTDRGIAASSDVLRARGEPTEWRMLHDSLCIELLDTPLLTRIGSDPAAIAEPLSWFAERIRTSLEAAPLLKLLLPRRSDSKREAEAVLWWLGDSLAATAASPLSDRVEHAVARILRQRVAIQETILMREVCARFPRAQTPSRDLIQLCLRSYGDEHAPGHWRLRAEDDLGARADEIDTILADLTSLGERLGFRVDLGVPSAGEWALRWYDNAGHTPYVFAVQPSAVLGVLLLNPPSVPRPEPVKDVQAGAGELRTTRCLVLPGGRAPLVSYKLRHDPRLGQQVMDHSWQFLKFRHLRHLVREISAKQLDHYTFQTALGLDPILEQDEAQLSLW
jgi:hypothetical protein